ncbi:UNKNOWN [Stylonychia lemnae]|uniref:Uncharacterized protein n=1 Tax=Stylonychia lemnae TaxID=5949 RepID=A0A078ATQ0_STYLE|nr:UNKNOWN [Stylonychia lemnae]|eukprot:CDW85356.1 UNKNOWN [Stylonychia lemnae]
MNQGQRDHHANQMNPNSEAFKSAGDNKANQMNPNNPVYSASEGVIGAGIKSSDKGSDIKGSSDFGGKKK